MASKKSNANDLNLPVSTGAVETPGPESRSLEASNESTGVVEYQAPGTSVNNASNEASVNFATPTEPVTMTASWLSEAEAKVITAKHQAAWSGGSAEAETKDSTEAPAETAAPATEAPAEPAPATEQAAAPAEGSGE